MPGNIVEVEVTAALAGFPEDTFGAVVVVGTTTTGATATAKQYFDRGEVVADHGESSDLCDAVDAVLQQGAAVVYGIVTGKTAIVDELIAGSTIAGVTTGTLAGVGVIDPKSPITVTVDGVAKTVVYSNVATPATPGANEAALNTDSKQFKLGTATAGGAGIKWTYTTLSWSAVQEELTKVDYEIFVFSEFAVNLKWLGLMKAFTSHANSKTKILPFAMQSALSVTDTHTITPLIGSRHLYGVAHKSSDDVGCCVAGVMAIKKPWVTMMWKRPQGVGQVTHYTDSEIGKRGQANTFEGGDASNLGPINVLMPIAGTLVLSNGLSTDGIGGEFGGWLDVTRTRNWLVSKVKFSLAQLRLASEKIPFTDAGLNAVRDAVEAQLITAVNLGALASYTLKVPTAAQLLTADKIARRLTGIVIGAQLAGDVHEFVVKLNLTV